MNLNLFGPPDSNDVPGLEVILMGPPDSQGGGYEARLR